MAKPDTKTPETETHTVASAPLTTTDFLAAVDLLIKSRGPEVAQGLSADQLKEILASTAQSAAQGMQKALKPENPTAPNVSAYNPTGEAKPTLCYTAPDGTVRPRKTFFVGAKMDADLLTPLEVALFNRFTTNKIARNGKWTATLKQNGNDQELHVYVPHKEMDQRLDLPNGLFLILRELLDGPDAVNHESIAHEVESLRREVAALKAAPAA
jgi:hypothetical protein